MSESRVSNLEESSYSSMSQILHVIKFCMRKPKPQFDQGMLIMSIDVDVGCKELGAINGGKNDRNVHDFLSEAEIGAIENHAVPQLVNLFSDCETPVTFALRGQLAETEAPLVNLLINSPIEHDIGAHGYYHRTFQSMTQDEAMHELTLVSEGMKKLGFTPRTFIFPRNSVGHLNLLQEFGYKCYRAESGSFRKDEMFIASNQGLFNIQPSLFLSVVTTPFFLRKLLNIAITNKAPLHIWFHPWNFGPKQQDTERFIAKVFLPFLRYAKAKERKGELTIETMLSAATKKSNLEK